DGAIWAPSAAGVIGVADPDAPPAKGGKPAKNGRDTATPVPGGAVLQQIQDSIRAQRLLRAYRTRGHQLANLDPLHLTKNGSHPELEYTYHGFAESDLDREIAVDGAFGFKSVT